MYKKDSDKVSREGLSRYNHISNGGFSCKTYIENDSQFLEIGMSCYGISQTTKIYLNKKIINSLIDVLEHAKAERQVVQLDERDSYTVTTPAPDASYKEDYEIKDRCG